MSEEFVGGVVRKHRFGPIVELENGRMWQLQYSIDRNVDEWVEIEAGDYPEIYFGEEQDSNDPEPLSTWEHDCPKFPNIRVQCVDEIRYCPDCGTERPIENGE